MAETPREESRYEEIRRVTLVGAVVNFLVAVVKLAAGLLGQSQALIADAVHSISDLATDFLVLFAAKHGSRAADESHPYGHGRIETLATLVLGTALIVTGIGIGWDAVRRLLHPEMLLQPGWLALIVALLSIFAKEWVYRYTMVVARRLNSRLLEANAWHSRSDAIASLIAVVGIAGTMAGYPYLDAVAAIGVALMILKIGLDLAWHGAHELVDTALDSHKVEEIRRAILSVEGVEAIHTLRTRRMGGGALVDVHVLVDPRLSVSEGHYIAEEVRDRLVGEIGEVQDVLVHVDPEDDECGAPCRGLPDRRDLMARLRASWENIPGSERIERVTLHYLRGKVTVEIALPFDAVSDLEDARRLSAVLAESAARIDGVEGIRACFFEGPHR